ncbi:nickel pincer cofactor biosynthesis protein LarC [Methanocalculus taiwanensis]|uniref:Putative nickel insertion protein n=1 Tax=Methanocalculus taiwanensis TaxID=106207 RepID=A0ABD4TKM7_9EURY|nr:nickel pincer cofactor biosynthesis protein LarC [Methanocalculus taiwanensis]MCQ1538375.1 nickel pincer cofactor biosynthesis protein LarC [Methanocalculus taiwanensis]
MRTILFDPVNGAAGDMITGALLAAGADREAVIRAMASLVQIPETSIVTRCGIQATYVKTHAKEGSRTLEEVLARLRRSDATEDVKEMAARVFTRIHNAETRVHGDHAHFHEVGADDAIADVIGACTALLSLAPDAVAILPLPLGRGTIRSAHGIMPVPAPATAYIFEESGLLTRRTDEETGELVTPTGAALLAEFRRSFAEGDENGTIAAVGYGAGTRNPKDRPNVLRVMILESNESLPVVDILETNVDDVDGEVIAHTISRLHREGARDASAAPIIMKKGRPGHLIRVICRTEDSERLAKIMAEELGTLGVRCIPSVHRFIADRRVLSVRIPEGDEIGVKIGYSKGNIISVKAEFDAVAAAAERNGLSVRDVKKRAEEIAYRELEEWRMGE